MGRRGRKNVSGSWLHGVLLERGLQALTVLMATTGFVLGFIVRGVPAVDDIARGLAWWTVVSSEALLMTAMYGAVIVFLKRTGATWGSRFDAERRVGDRIEHALVQSGCAFAHDVRQALGGGGNVDHVALTPVGIWVVETKAAWLEGELFQDALRQAASNAERVGRHLATKIPIRAALVTADDSRPFESEHDWEGMPVTAFGVVSFWKRLRKECDDRSDEVEEWTRVQRMVWNLGSTVHLDA